MDVHWCRVNHFHHHPLSPGLWTVQNQSIFLSTASSMDVLGVFLSTTSSVNIRVYVCTYKCRTVRHLISHNIQDARNCSYGMCFTVIAVIFPANWKQFTIYPMTVNLHKCPPPPREKKARLRQWHKYILRAEGGISCTMPRKCSPLTQIRREQKMPGPLLLVYFMIYTVVASNEWPSFNLSARELIKENLFRGSMYTVQY